MLKHTIMFAAVAGLVLALAPAAQAVDIETVPVGDVGNMGELSGAGAGAGGSGPDRMCGAVDYAYNIGTYEVTAGQYTDFLNAVAATDSYGLYNPSMWSTTYGCKIQQSGSPGNYSYSVDADRANRPVNYVNWGDAARFANWLHNGQLPGAQDLSTTEDGSYYLNGAMTVAELLAVTREGDWKWAIPTEDEWYKAAYYDPNHGGPGVGGYWDYPNGSDTAPTATTPLAQNAGPPGSANYNNAVGATTDVGAYSLWPTDSPYGTFDQAGNVWEWNEALIGVYRGKRGGSWLHSTGLPASFRNDEPVSNESDHVGFRVAQVPEPATMALLGLGGLVLIRGRRSRGVAGKRQEAV